MKEKDLCKIFGKITKRELDGKYFSDSLTTNIKFRVEKNGKNFDFFAGVNNGNCEGCYLSIGKFEIGKNKYFLINKKNFQVHTVSDEDYFAVESYNNPANKLDISKIEKCDFGASNVTYEVGDIDENIFKKEEILEEKVEKVEILEEKNFLEKIDFFYVFIFVIFLISIIFTIFSLKKFKKKL